MTDAWALQALSDAIGYPGGRRPQIGGAEMVYDPLTDALLRRLARDLPGHLVADVVEYARLARTR